MVAKMHILGEWKMKVLQVLDCFYPQFDGPVNVIVNIAKIANKLGLAEVELLVPEYPEKINVEGLIIHRCKSFPAAEGYRMSTPQLDKKIKKLIKNGGFDIIHVHSPFTLGQYVVNIAKKYKIPVCFGMHTKYKSDFERKIKSKLIQKFMMNYIMKTINKSDHVLAVSNGTITSLKEYGCTHRNITVIRNGTDMKPVALKNEIKQDIINKYNLQGKFVFLFVGRIVENKNIQFSLKVLKNLKKKSYDNFVFLIVGAGDYVTNLKELAKKYDLTDNVIFTGKIMDREYLSSIYACSDLFMFPSVFDTFGIVALEAAANNLPSAMIENCCASELITNGQNGLALPEDANIWADKILELIENRDQLNNIKNNVNTIYISWETIVKEYIDFYSKVLDSIDK